MTITPPEGLAAELAALIAGTESGNSARGKKLLAAWAIRHQNCILAALSTHTEAMVLLREAGERIAMLQRAISTGEWHDPELAAASGKHVSMLRAAADTSSRAFIEPTVRKDDLLARIDALLGSADNGG